MQHNVFDQGRLDFLQERNTLFIDCFFKHTSSLLILYPFYFCLQRQTSSVVRMLWDYRKHAQACKQARTSCLSCCILFGGGWGGKHWETSLELLLIPNIMLLLCAQNHTPVFQKTAYSLSDMKTKMKERVRERKNEEKIGRRKWEETYRGRARVEKNERRMYCNIGGGRWSWEEAGWGNKESAE